MIEERRQDYPQIVERLTRIEERQLATDKRINGSLDVLDKHVSQGHIWRVAILGIIVTIVINIIIFSNMYGYMSKTVSVNERNVLRILDKLDKQTQN